MIRPITIIVIAIGGLISAGGVLAGVLTAPEGESMNWLPFAAGLAVGTTVEWVGIVMLLADQRNAKEAQHKEEQRRRS